MKKTISLILILCLSVGFSLLTACDANKDKDDNTASNEAIKLLEKSSQYYSNAKNVRMDSLIDSVLIYNDMFSGEPAICGTQLNLVTVIYNDPFSFTSEGLFTYDDTIEDGGISYIMQNNTKSTQYGVVNDDKISVYQFANEEWLKADLSNEDFISNDTLGLNYISKYDKFMTEGKILGNEKISGLDTIKAEYKLTKEYSKIIFLRYGFQEFAALIGNDTDKIISDLMKDARFTVWFDEKSDEVVKLEVDLTSLMKTFRKLVIEDNKEHLSKEKYDYLNYCADKISIKNTIKFSNVDQNKEFVLPQEAKDAKVHGQ